MLYTLLDRIPSFDKRYVDSGKTCSGMYQQILQEHVPADDPERAQALKSEYDDAMAKAESLLEGYQKYRREHNRAWTSYLALQNKDGADRVALADAEDDMLDAWQN